MSNVIPFNATINAPDWCAKPMNSFDNGPDIWFKSDAIPFDRLLKDGGGANWDWDFEYVGDNDAIRQIYGELSEYPMPEFFDMIEEIEAASDEQQATIWWMLSEGHELSYSTSVALYDRAVTKGKIDNYVVDMLEELYDLPVEYEKVATQNQLGCVETAMTNWAKSLIENGWLVDNDEIDLLLDNDQHCYIMKQRYEFPHAEDMTAEQLQLAVQVLLCSYRFSHLAKLAKVVETCKYDGLSEFNFAGQTYVVDGNDLWS
jgi:hypothetical protein